MISGCEVVADTTIGINGGVLHRQRSMARGSVSEGTMSVASDDGAISEIDGGSVDGMEVWKPNAEFAGRFLYSFMEQLRAAPHDNEITDDDTYLPEIRETEGLEWTDEETNVTHTGKMLWTWSDMRRIASEMDNEEYCWIINPSNEKELYDMILKIYDQLPEAFVLTKDGFWFLGDFLSDELPIDVYMGQCNASKEEVFPMYMETQILQMMNDYMTRNGHKDLTASEAKEALDDMLKRQAFE